MNENNDGKVFVTSDGLQVPIAPISLIEMDLAEAGLRQDFLDQGEPLDPPSYTVQTVGGGEEIHFHDETTLEVPGDEVKTAENLKAWEAHIEALKRHNAERSVIQSNIILDGLQVELPEDDAWEIRQRSYHIRIPVDPIEKRRHYIQTVILKTPDDLMRLMEQVMILSTQGVVSEEAVKAAVNTFRGAVPGIGKGNTKKPRRSRSAGRKVAE